MKRHHKTIFSLYTLSATLLAVGLWTFLWPTASALAPGAEASTTQRFYHFSNNTEWIFYALVVFSAIKLVMFTVFGIHWLKKKLKKA